MDADVLSEFLVPDYIYLMFIAGLLAAARSKLLRLVRSVGRTKATGPDCKASGLAVRHFRVLTEAGAAAPVVWDAQAGGLIENPALVRFLGFDRQRVRTWPRGPRACARLIHPADRGEWFHALRHSLQSGQLDFSVRVIRADGHAMPLKLSAEIESDRRGALRRVTGLLLDLTPRQALPDSTPSARGQSEENRHEVPASPVLHSAAALAHELSQPVGKALGLALAARNGLAEFPDVPPELGHKLKGIVEASMHASELIRRVQSRSHGESIPFRELDANVIVVDAVQKLRGADFLREVTVSLQLADDLPKISGDSVELIQVLHNLIRNAGEAMTGLNQRHKPLVVQTRSDRFGEVGIVVTDRGPGLPLFGKERAVRGRSAPKTHGHGLGLLICRSIAVAHGGKITGANNADGPGAIFTLTLPAIEPARSAATNPDEIALDRLCRR